MARTKAIPNRAELILEAAQELFSRYGYERTSIDDIAQHLGIGKGSVYLDFRTKEDILVALLTRHANYVLNFVQELVDNGGSPLKTLSKILEEPCLMVFDKVKRDIHTPEGLIYTSTSFKDRFSTFYKRKRSLILEVLLRASAAGEIPKKNATEDVAQLVMMSTSSIYPPYLDNYSESTEPMTRELLQKRAKALVRLIIAGLKDGA
jgi:AcrR family transcriptional regulator